MNSTPHDEVPPESPSEAGLQSELGDAVDALAAHHVGSAREQLVPGAVALVARRGVMALLRAYGYAQTHGEGVSPERPRSSSGPAEPAPRSSSGPAEPAPRPMRTDTAFDVASITKVCVTTASFMRVVADGRLELDAPVADLLPEFRGAGKHIVQVRDLLAHRAGLWEWWPLYVEANDRVGAVTAAARLPLRYPPGEGAHYSDLGMILAGAIVEELAGERLDAYARQILFEPLGMRDTGFLPDARLRMRCAATSTGNEHERHMLATGDPYPTGRRPADFDRWRAHTLVGEVEDGNSFYALDGVAGHAGLFSTADDLARYGHMLLAGGEYRGLRLFPETVVRDFARPGVADDEFGLGFRTNQRAAVGLGSGGYGHAGFTGVQLFVEPDTELVVVLLTNRTHRAFPYPSIEPLWRDLLEAATRALVP